MKESMTVRQTAILCVISMLALKLIALPSLLFEQSKSSGLIITIAMFLFDYLILYIFLSIKERYPNLSFYEIIEKFLGKIIAKIIYILLFFFFLFKMSILMNESISYMQDIVDEEYTVIRYLFTFLPVITIMVYTGLKSTARTCEFGFVFILIGFIICLFLSSTSIGLGEIGPIFVQNPLDAVSACFNLSFWYSDFLFILILSDKIKVEKNTKKTIFSFVIIFSILLTILYITYFRLFGTTSFLHKNAIENITQFNRNIGNAGNIDIVSILTYLFIIFFQGALYLTCMKVIYEKIIGYENKIHSLISINLIIIFMQLFLIYNIQRIIFVAVNYLKYYSILFWLIIPIFCVCVLIFDKEKNNGKNYKRIYKKN